jgi:hypothetical protein
LPTIAADTRVRATAIRSCTLTRGNRVETLGAIRPHLRGEIDAWRLGIIISRPHPVM